MISAHRKILSPKKLQEDIDQYFIEADKREPYKRKITTKGGTQTEEFKRPYDLLGLAIHLDVHRDTLRVFASGEYDESVPEEFKGEVETYGTYSAIVTRAKQRIVQSLLDLGLNPFNKNTNILSLNLMSNYGFKKQEKTENDNRNTNLNANVEPDKQTNAQLIESILGKVGAKNG